MRKRAHEATALLEAGRRPVQARKVRYFADREFQGLARSG